MQPMPDSYQLGSDNFANLQAQPNPAKPTFPNIVPLDSQRIFLLGQKMKHDLSVNPVIN